ncbi:hypothetical protein B7494_g7339 [Chlorociboria aeruginascens]|nr:hypothetical protein B7494_g7339 [Chlorociboria aeruginascens]
MQIDLALTVCRIVVDLTETIVRGYVRILARRKPHPRRDRDAHITPLYIYYGVSIVLNLCNIISSNLLSKIAIPTMSSSSDSITPVSPPWTLKGNVYSFMTHVSSSNVQSLLCTESKSFLYSSLEAASSFSQGNFLGGLALVQIIRYTESPIGPYDEMLIVPGTFEYSVEVEKKGKKVLEKKKNLRLTRIYVSQKNTCWNGRKNWNIPKHLARFSFTDIPNGAVKIAVYPHDTSVLEAKPTLQPFFKATFKTVPYIPAIPISTTVAKYVRMDLSIVQPPLPSGQGSEDELPGTDQWCSVLPYQYSRKTSLGWWDLKQKEEERKGSLDGIPLIDASTKTTKCYRFPRVPYALPPVGPRRWQKPEALPDTYSYGDAQNPWLYKSPSSICPQLSAFSTVPSASEDCLQCNIYVPLGIPPDKGWPVLFYIHGGFLQYGSNSSEDPSCLLSETDVKCVIVSPGYRLGVFGFLASREIWEHGSKSGLAANFGFWDQRLALEWTYDNIEAFGGNKSNITVGGLSAGSYATFHQLAHDIGPNSTRQIIRRVIQLSNGCGVEPKRLPEAQEQFNDLLSVLKIPRSWKPTQKLQALREKTSDELIRGVEGMKQKFLRPVLDGDFISKDLFLKIYDGSFGKCLGELGIKTIIGDLTQEAHIYKGAFPPESYQGLIDRLSWDYPRDIAIAICEPWKPSSSHAPRLREEWMGIFGNLYTDMQIQSTMHGYIKCISTELTAESIYRYKIDWRTRSVDKVLPKEFGATHGTDLSIWLYGNGESLTADEKEIVREWLKPLGEFIRGDNVMWGTKSLSEVRTLTSDGRIEVKEDEVQERKLPLWNLTKEVTLSRPENRNFKL